MATIASAHRTFMRVVMDSRACGCDSSVIGYLTVAERTRDHDESPWYESSSYPRSLKRSWECHRISALRSKPRLKGRSSTGVFLEDLRPLSTAPRRSANDARARVKRPSEFAAVKRRTQRAPIAVPEMT